MTHPAADNSKAILPADLTRLDRASMPAPPAPAGPSARVSHSTDVGVLKPSARTSQNDDRLPTATPPQELSSGNESGSGPFDLSTPELPFLDSSPAEPSQVFVSRSHTTPTPTPTRVPGYTHFHSSSDSQSIDALSFSASGNAINESVSDSFSSTNNTFSSHNTSGESSGDKTNSSLQSNNSLQTNVSAATNGSGSSNEHSSGSQADSQSSHLSFNNVGRSTPKPEVVRHQYPGFTPPRLDVSPTQTSPVPSFSSQRIQRHFRSPTKQGSPSSGHEAAKHEIIAIPDDPSQDFGQDLSSEDVAALLEEEEQFRDDNPTQILAHVIDHDDPIGDSPFRSSSSPARSTTPTRRSGNQAKQQSGENNPDATSEPSWAANSYFSSDEDNDASRSALDPSVNLEISHSTVDASLASRPSSRMASASTSAPAGSRAGASAASTSALHADQSHSSKFDHSIANTSAGQANESVTESVKETQDIPESTGPRTPPEAEATASLSSQVRRKETKQKQPHRDRSRRSPRAGRSRTQELPSSQSSSANRPAETFLDKLLSVASQESAGSQDEAEEPVFAAVPKRQRLNTKEASAVYIASSIDDEQFWHSAGKADERETRSRSVSQDISSFPLDYPSEQDIDPLGAELGDETGPDDGPSSPTTTAVASNRSTSSGLRRAGSSARTSPKPKTSHTRELRKRNSTQGSAPPSPARRVLRRLHSATDALHVYQTDDPVWALWRKCYYAGIVRRRDKERDRYRYEIEFVDNDKTTSDGVEMRPLKLRLGTEVMAQKTELHDYPAVVEGMKITSDLDRSHVEVRFEDDSRANLSLRQVSLTEEMMEKLDEVMNWNQEDAIQSSQPATLSRAGSSISASLPISRQSSTISAPATPRKGKGHGALVKLASSTSSVASTPSRRAKNEPVMLVSSHGTPSRRGKDLFKDLRFVLSLSIADPGSGVDLSRPTTAKIQAGGGIILPDFSTTVDSQGMVQPNVILISYTALRTPKYIEALALNVPRISYRWIDACVEKRELVPLTRYHLPAGFSKEMGHVVCNLPDRERKVFDELRIGLCGPPSFKAVWERPLSAAGATVVTVTPSTGPQNCDYVVFSNPKNYTQYCNDNVFLPTLADEWLIQCFINQEVLSIYGHDDYTDLEKKGTQPSHKTSKG
ncbi:hypothetical protein BGZ67_007428 [Mortierella alpina]|nr:hypothetical protein BGZ67_007428 [Mortierella alpina]